MKSIVMLFSASLISLLWGCNKSDESAPAPSLIVGEWVWNGSSGGFAGQTLTPRAGDRTILKFNSDNQFSLSRNDTLLFSGTYSLGKARSIYSGNDEAQVTSQVVTINKAAKVTAPVVMNGVITTLTANQLSIGDNVYDGYSSNFVRSK